MADTEGEQKLAAEAPQIESPSKMPDSARDGEALSPGERLYRQAQEARERREELAALLDENCTFRPNLPGSARRGSTGGRVTNGEGLLPSHERLYKQAAEHEARLEALRAQLDENCTFAPRLSKKALEMKKRERAAVKSAYDILYQQALELRAKLEAVRKEHGAGADCTFTPVLNKRSAALKRPGSAVSRLYNPQWVSERRKEERNDPLHGEYEECSFQPHINRGPAAARSASADGSASATATAAENGASTGTGAAAPATAAAAEEAESKASPSGVGKPGKQSDAQPVHERLYRLAPALTAAQQEKAVAKAEAELAECSFSPDIHRSKASAKASLAGSGRMGEGAGAAAGKRDPFARLYTHAMEKQQRAKLQVSPEELGCTFTPEISAVSRRLTEEDAKNIPRHHLLYSDGLQRQRVRSMPEANQERSITEDDKRECSFQPKISPLPGKHLVTVPVHDRLYENARQKQVMLGLAASGAPLPEVLAAAQHIAGGGGGVMVGSGYDADGTTADGPLSGRDTAAPTGGGDETGRGEMFLV